MSSASPIAPERSKGLLSGVSEPPAEGSGVWQQAQKIAQAAAAVGFDWPTLAGTLEKTAEELAEVREAHAACEAADSDSERSRRQQDLLGECGDLLFAALNVCRLAGVAPEKALAACNAKFVRRFAAMEASGLPPGGRASDLAHWQRLWQEAKQAERLEAQSSIVRKT